LLNRIADISQRKAAIVAGFGFLISVIFTVFAGLFIDDLFVKGDAAATAKNILVSEVRFRAGIVCWLFVIIGDVVRAWALYVFFKSVNKSLSLLAAWFTLIHVAILGAAMINLVLCSLLLSGAESLAAFETDQLYALVLLFFNGYNYGFLIGLFFFSLHLGTLGYLVYISGYIPKILSVLLIIASVGYMVNSVGKIIYSNYPEIIWTVLAGPLFIGELALILWLAIKGGKEPPQDADKESEEEMVEVINETKPEE